ncbi:cyclase family protein [Lonepinella sp. BR2271]|uniref:cyclase family protein n=1 Tax=Lonepinella sp. BR2271 TaxID=3434550 RepID=UPI003F6DC027
MNKWIDLSMPISRNHIRWNPTIEKKGNFDDGDLFEATQLQVSCHAFTHMDALSHIKKDAYNILDIPIETYMGEFYVLDLSEVIGDNFAITPEVLSSIWPESKEVEKIIFKTCWDLHYSYNSKEFWGNAPYITFEGAEYLANKNLKIIAFDFPQDYPIRGWLTGTMEKPLTKHVTHHHLLMKGVTLVEYICNTKNITSPTVDALMIPIAIENTDGSPCRVLIKNHIQHDEFQSIAEELIKNLGGQENISALTHCATRIRVVLKNDRLMNKKSIEKINKVKGLFSITDQYQIIFGTTVVDKVYNKIKELSLI